MCDWAPEILFDPEEAKARGFDRRTIALARWSRKAREEGALLIAEIEAAFAGVPRPGITLSVALGLDDEWNLSPGRQAELRACDPEEDWRDVKPGVRFHNYYNFADAEGCRFYLPAFLREELKVFPYSDRGDILGLLSRPDRTGLLNERQMNCLVRFAELCERYPENPNDDEF